MMVRQTFTSEHESQWGGYVARPYLAQLYKTNQMTDSQRNALLHAVTQYDIKQSRKKYYNVYALAQYLMAVDRARDAMADDGLDLRAALVSCFNGRLLDVCLKAVGLPTSTRQEQFGRL